MIRLLPVGLVMLGLIVLAGPAWGQRQSVNPGINDSFRDPNVNQFVERFEREGREVYDKRQEIVDACGIKEGQAVADVGAGTGLFTRLLALKTGRKGRVFAVDIARKFVDHVEQSCREAGLNHVVGVVCKQDSVELPPESVDLVFICDTYHHFEFPAETMRSIHRALRPKGQVVLIDFKREEGVSSDWILNHVRAGQETFVKEVVAAGFRQIEEKPLLKDNYFVRFQKAELPAESREAKPRLVPLPDKAPQPADNPATDEKVKLGKQLFFDPRLSGDNTLSCASCHLPDKAFADGKARSTGHGGKVLERNTPSVLNSGFFERLTWDGRAESLESQALGPITSPVEMNQDLDELQRELQAVPGYVEQFKQVFGEAPNRTNIVQALAAFQRTLVAGASPFDRYLNGDRQALSPAAKRGLELFTGDAGCIRCHHGPLLSDNQHYRLGVAFEDPGRAKVTGHAEDRFRFRTPSLRNIAQTAPYMHDGSLATLNQVVTFYYRGIPTDSPDDLPLDAEPLFGQSFSEISDLVAFLESLSGQIPQVEPPVLP